MLLFAVGQPAPLIRYKRRRPEDPADQPSKRLTAPEIPPSKHGCPFSILHYWRPRCGCFPDAMHTIGGVIKDLVRMLMGLHEKSRLKPEQVKYMRKKNGVDLRTRRKWEAGKLEQRILI